MPPSSSSGRSSEVVSVLPELPVCQCGREPTLRAVNSKPIEAAEEEARSNPRSRSAKLRVAGKLPAAEEPNKQ